MSTMDSKRVSGLLLHPTSLPGPHGIGDLGEGAYRFVDFLHETGQSLWQILPLGPPSCGDSPYSSFSAFAGNPNLISLQNLVQEGLLSASDLVDDRPAFPETRVDYGALYRWKTPLLQKAYLAFRSAGSHPLREAFERFVEKEAWWLDDYALFAALKDVHNGAVWQQWDPDAAHRRPEALARWKAKLADEIQACRFWQFLFDRQWAALKQYCNQRRVRLIGDIPIYCAYDSDDVWAHPELFHLDKQGRPTVVAGVPPDYFSETGQLWGNPLYDWDAMARNGYQWWIERFHKTLQRVDIIRLDHFRGFEAYWEVPASETTAVNGRWVKGPGAALLEAIRDALGGLPILAENLGLITPEVEALRKQFGIPGMGVLHFAFDPDTQNSDYLPHKYIRNLVAYTGTHDNDTTVGWWNPGQNGGVQPSDYQRREREFAAKYMDVGDRPINWVCIRTIMASVADIVIFPLQDVLGLGSEARMNVPGIGEGNWQWRFRQDQITSAMRDQLKELTSLYGRRPK